jgi:predicted nucleotidyltransferase
MQESYINDIDIIVEAINNKDLKDAVEMLLDLKEDLKILLLMA